MNDERQPPRTSSLTWAVLAAALISLGCGGESTNGELPLTSSPTGGTTTPATSVPSATAEGETDVISLATDAVDVNQESLKVPSQFVALHPDSLVQTDPDGSATIRFVELKGKSGACEINHRKNTETSLQTRFPDPDSVFLSHFDGSSTCWFRGPADSRCDRCVKIGSGVVISFVDPALRIVVDGTGKARVAVFEGQATVGVVDAGEEELSRNEEAIIDLRTGTIGKARALFSEEDITSFRRLAGEVGAELPDGSPPSLEVIVVPTQESYTEGVDPVATFVITVSDELGAFGGLLPRHFAATLDDKPVEVSIVPLSDADAPGASTGSYLGSVSIDALSPGEYKLTVSIEDLGASFGGGSTVFTVLTSVD